MPPAKRVRYDSEAAAAHSNDQEDTRVVAVEKRRSGTFVAYFDK